MKTHRTTRLLLVSVAMALLLTACPAALAQGTQALAALEADGGALPVFLASWGDTLYMLRDDGLYQWTEGDGEARLLSALGDGGFDGAGGKVPYSASLFAGEDGLYMMQGAYGPLYRFDEAQGVFVLVYGQNASGEGDTRIYRGLFSFEGAVYGISLDPMNPRPQLVVMENGAAPRVLKSDIGLAVPYQPGTLLVVRDERMTTGAVALAVYDLATGALTDKLPLTEDYRGLSYDAAGDVVYLSRAGEVRVSRGFSQPETALRLPLELDARAGALLHGPQYAYVREGAVLVLRPDDMPAQATRLRVLGHTWDLPVSDFAFQNQDIALSQSTAYPEDTPALTLHMMSGEGAADVYVIYSSQYNLDALLEKGWYLDLGQDEVIADALSAMYPYLQQVLSRDGRILAAPVSASYSALACFTLAWEEMGLTRDDMPRTYGELLAFVARWNGELADEYPHISLFGQGAEGRVYKSVLLNNLLTQWRLQHLSQGTPVRAEPLREVIRQLLKADFSRIGESTAAANAFEGGRQVFYPGHPVLLAMGGEPIFFTALSVLPDTPAYTSAEAMLLLVNPQTPEPQAALRFVRYMLEHLSPDNRIFLMPAENQPVNTPGFNLDWLQEEIRLTEQRVAAAEGAERRELEGRLSSMQADYREQLQHAWLASPEGIDNLRALDATFALRQAVEMPDGGKAASTAMTRLLDGQLSLDRFISEYDQAEKLREGER